jgi:coproporphyrinogen III oxidase-like Fe-S oxidoreductase
MAHYERQVGELSDLGLMEYNGGNLKLTRRGCLLSNEVFGAFCLRKNSLNRE